MGIGQMRIKREKQALEEEERSRITKMVRMQR
jgi:hypothetical protein